MTIRPRLGLQVSIVLIIAFVVVCLTIATAVGIYFASARAAQEGAQRLFSEITARVADRVDSQISDLLDLADLGASLPATAEPIGGSGAGHGVVAFLRRALEQNPNLYSAYIAQADGGFLQLIATRDDRRVLAANNAPPGTRFILRAIAGNGDGGRRETWTFLGGDPTPLGSLVNEAPTYDPRQRPWYQAAVGGAASRLSDPYVFNSLQEPGLTASHGFAGGVFGVDISLRGMSDLVGHLTISPHGGIALIDQKGQILAVTPALVAGLPKEIGPLAKLAEIDDPLMQVLSNATASDVASLVATDRGAVLVQATDWRDHGDGQAIFIEIVSPFADFTAPIQDMQLRILKMTVLVLLVVVPLSMLLARNIARSVKDLVAEAERVRLFDFGGLRPNPSFIREFYDLALAFGLMKETIASRSGALAAAQRRLERLVDLGIALSAERDSGRLMDMILMGAKELSNADGGTLYMKDDHHLRFQIIRNDSLGIKMGGEGEPPPSLPAVPLTLADGKPNRANVVSQSVHQQQTINIPDAYDESRFDFSGTKAFDQRTGYHSTSFLTVPLKPRGGDVIGALQLINARPADNGEAVVPFSAEIQRFVEALAAQASTALYNRELLDAQERLMDAMIQILAGAIDAKSPYTGGHCERVPELSLMLAEEACKVTEGPLADFAFHTADEWREFKIGAWLHDCGKVTTPEYVVDKATKLETIYNRVHEVRMRFEVLLRDARITMLEAVAAGTSPPEAEAGFEAAKAELVADYAFIAECNLGGEFMAPELVERMKAIAQRTWKRHFDDRLGLSQEELRRLESVPVQALPADETLLADKPNHVIARPKTSALFDPALRFKTKIPENLYNFGEIYNLGIGRGTLTEEERFKINEHIIQTIIMLERMPFPKQLSRVAEYAGTHHETLTGSGYPRCLEAADQDDAPVAACSPTNLRLRRCAAISSIWRRVSQPKRCATMPR